MRSTSLAPTLALALTLGSFASLGSVGCSKAEPPSPPATPPPTAAAPKPEPPRVFAPLTQVAGQDDGSAVALAKLGAQSIAYVADEDEKSIHAIDVATKRDLGATLLGGRPGQLLVSPDGKLLVALRDEASIAVLGASADPAAPLYEVARIQTAEEPIALSLTDGGKSLLVASGWGHRLEAFRLENRERTLSVDVAREPRAVTASSDGTKAFVAHASAGHLSVVDLKVATAEPKKVDMGMSGWTTFGHGGGGSLLFMIAEDNVPDEEFPRFRCGTGLLHRVTFPARVARQAFALAKLPPAGKDTMERIFSPHVAVATGDAMVASSGYGGGGTEGEAEVPTEMFDVDVIDANKVTRATGAASEVRADLRIGADACRLPRAATVDAKARTLLVSCLGGDTIQEYDARGSTPTGALKRKWKVASGPIGIAVDAEKHEAVVWSQFARSVSIVNLAETRKGATQAEPVSIPLAKQSRNELPELTVRGRKLFHAGGDARIARDGRACASCHPDGRDDGLVWSSPDGPRQTIFLAGRVSRPAPFGWRGQHASLQAHMKDTMKNLKGTGLTAEEHDALAAYLVSLAPPPRAKRELNEAEARGRTLFRSSGTGCSSCHAEKTGFTDNDIHEVQSATVADRQRQFIAPSLHAVGEGAPYFHDGRYATLEELLRKSDGKMGNTAQLSDADIGAMAAYLRTL